VSKSSRIGLDTAAERVEGGLRYRRRGRTGLRCLVRNRVFGRNAFT